MTIPPLDTTTRVPTPDEWVAWMRAANNIQSHQRFEDAWIEDMLRDYAECVRRHTRAKIDATTLEAARLLDADLFALAARCNQAAYAVRDALEKCRAE